jgi:CDP-diacylglycerol--serine O-phosphatidyltransferase
MSIDKFRYILPNLFTLANILAGLFSITQAMQAETADQMMLAAWFIVIAMVCDLFDGRVARLTDAETEFGTQMDSLTDAMSFGVAPAILMYAWGLKSMGPLGVVFAFIFTAGAIMRLARFNVMAEENGGASKYFLGLPTPLAAGTVVSVVMAHSTVTGQAQVGASWNVALMATLLGGLMISGVKYRTFKDFDLQGRAIWVVLIAAGLVSTIAVVAEPTVAFVVCMVLYIVLGLVGGLVDLGRNVLEDDDDSVDTVRSDDGYLREARDEER